VGLREPLSRLRPRSAHHPLRKVALPGKRGQVTCSTCDELTVSTGEKACTGRWTARLIITDHEQSTGTDHLRLAALRDPANSPASVLRALGRLVPLLLQ
jgi:hypothetical protein